MFLKRQNIFGDQSHQKSLMIDGDFEISLTQKTSRLTKGLSSGDFLVNTFNELHDDIISLRAKNIAQRKRILI